LILIKQGDRVFVQAKTIINEGFHFLTMDQGEGEFDRFLDMRRIHDSLVRGFRRVVAFDGFGADSFFGDEFYGEAEEVVEKSLFLGIEVVEGRYDVSVI
jgi:hypothetical protein